MAGDDLDWKKVFKKILLKNNPISNEIPEASSCERKCITSMVFPGGNETEPHSSELRILVNDVKLDSIRKEEVRGKDRKEGFNVTVQECNEEETDGLKVNKTPPDWNTAFKKILGESHAPATVSECYSVQDHKMNSREKIHMKPQKTYYRPKKQTEDEKRVKELLTLSRTFKQKETHYKLNEFDGAGINIFKFSKSSKNENPENFADFNKTGELKGSNSNIYLESTPLMGVITVKPYTKQDLESSGSITITEFWDEDLYSY